MKSGFLTTLSADLKEGTEQVWIIDKPLKYWSELLNCMIVVPHGFESKEPDAYDEASFFETDLASVPRLPIVYAAWGDRVHREAVIHDYLYRIDSRPQATLQQANSVFLEAMESRGVSWHIRYPMYWAVCAVGRFFYHKMFVNAQLF
jgi:hypothetical protein